MIMAEFATTTEPTLDLQQAATFLHLGLESMKELVASGEVPALSCNQKHTIMLRDDLIAYVREQGRKQAEHRRNKRVLPDVVPAAPRTTRGRANSRPDLSRYESTSTNP
jgi:hypothetical protein